jgi:NAD(P)-dependent dehydrogenase (short-subunit alcohol dehydrogenase family)
MAAYVVTGGSSGIGLSIARRLVADDNAVVLVARDRGRLDDAAASIGGRVGVVNNAAGNFACPTVDLSPNGFRAVVEISLFGCFHFSRAVARRLIDEGQPGAMLNIVATYAWTGAPGVAHSAAAKAGMIAFTKSVAREWAPHGIRVNALAPGFVPTENAVAGLAATEDAREHMRGQIPLGRFATPEEIAEPAAFLMSDSAAYVTGAVLTADGGRSLGGALHAVTPGP